MIASMTGYGKSSYSNENIKLTVEIKSINSKQLDLTLRLPLAFRDQETIIRTRLGQILERGKVEVNVAYENLRESAPIQFNIPTLKAYKKDLDNITEELNISQPQDWLSLLFRLPDVMQSKTPDADDAEKDILLQCVVEAAENLNESRLQEGRGLYAFFFEKTEKIRGYLNITEQYESERITHIREKLEQQLGRLQGVEIDRGRLEQELIYYIEKLDVTEEKQRLRSHLDYFEETLGSPYEEFVAGKGKKLGFISQEIGREINTLGSKSNDADMQKLVVMMKDELEQIKEQVLNVL